MGVCGKGFFYVVDIGNALSELVLESDTITMRWYGKVVLIPANVMRVVVQNGRHRYIWWAKSLFLCCTNLVLLSAFSINVRLYCSEL